MGVADELAGESRTSIEPVGLSDELAQHQAVLLATARLLLGSEEDARDVVQTTFEIALRNADSLRDRSRLLGWLLRIESREAFRIRRRLKRAIRGFAQDVVDDSLAEAGSLLALRQAVERLPRRQRMAVVLHYMVGLPVAETAQTMAISRNTVKTLLKSALAQLRLAMDA